MATNTPVVLATIASILRRLDTVYPPRASGKDTVARTRAALELTVGAALHCEASGDTNGYTALANTSTLVSIRGASFLQELLAGK